MMAQSDFVAAVCDGGVVQRTLAELGAQGAGVLLLADVEDDLPDVGFYNGIGDVQFLAKRLDGRKVHAGPPIRLPGLVYDSLGYTATVKRAVEFAKKHRATILYGHDSAQMEALKQAPAGFYD